MRNGMSNPTIVHFLCFEFHVRCNWFVVQVPLDLLSGSPLSVLRLTNRIYLARNRFGYDRNIFKHGHLILEELCSSVDDMICVVRTFVCLVKIRLTGIFYTYRLHWRCLCHAIPMRSKIRFVFGQCKLMQKSVVSKMRRYGVIGQ